MALKKSFFFLFIFTLLLAACSSSTPSLTEVKNVPHEVESNIHAEETLQQIHAGNDTYIVLQSAKAVSAKLTLDENVLNINFQQTGQENKQRQIYVYQLNRGNATYDTMNVFINGKATPFDNISM